MSKNVLFLVTGMTPQIITETVWALACDLNNAEPWIPDEIHVLSTEDGLNQIRATLFDDGVFAKFQQDYPILANVEFTKDCLHVITKDHKPLKDLKTPQDNVLAADMICQKVREFTQDDTINLHVSIAGGRKTMGFYAGYALSLYGRSQDRMSHVLVDSDYESAIGFYYPTLTDYFVEQRFTGKRLNAKDAQIWLANIPFVRMRASLNPDDMIANKDFSTVVEMINLSLQPINLTLNSKQKTIAIQDKTCKLTPKEFSLYLLAVQLRQNNETLYYPSKDIEGDTIGDAHQKRFNQIYGNYSSKDDIVVDEQYVRSSLTSMKKKFATEFGKPIAEKICIQSLDSGYGIALDASQIQLV
ncbi:CRISPR-associated ring nuclease Csm6 [Faucicola atlantae]|uniref:CRISPR-associated protein n=1 Tax=Faucicola atlantae TaxID=34059 RepID=A0A1B8QEX2_9GAMM|nr:CRISPR-associated ring nuclease Csm6 [Moraxella atlantae]OBX80518.1 CRISPR-associated protein [Moraxella atlantae]